MADDRIPTEDEIRRLPLRARIAFAARCARRVQPLFQHLLPDAPEKYRTAVAKAIDLAETVATRYVASAARADAAVAYGYATAAAAADAAAAAADAAAAAADAAADAATVARAAATAARAAEAAEAADDARALALIRQDFDLLRRLATEKKWDDETPVPPTAFGPMWPNGLPKGWPKSEAEPLTPRTETEQKIRGLVLALMAKADTSPEVIEEGLVKLYTAANQYHMARGGGVLNPDSFQQMISSLVPAGRD
jgi:hypothetical protein